MPDCVGARQAAPGARIHPGPGMSPDSASNGAEAAVVDGAAAVRGAAQAAAGGPTVRTNALPALAGLSLAVVAGDVATTAEAGVGPYVAAATPTALQAAATATPFAAAALVRAAASGLARAGPPERAGETGSSQRPQCAAPALPPDDDHSDQAIELPPVHACLLLHAPSHWDSPIFR